MTTAVGRTDEVERLRDGDDEQGAGWGNEFDPIRGPLLALTSTWRDVQQNRMSVAQRGQDDFAAMLKLVEDRLSRQITKELRAHPVWPWLSQYPGLGGVHTARLIAIIGNPHRFPGRVCEAGHHHAAAEGSRESGDEPGCGVTLADGATCTAQVGPVRRGTGTRSVWHYLGLHVIDGKLPKRRKGAQADWNPAGRTTCLMPGGLAEHIVRQRVPVYRDLYDATKDRLTRERGAGRTCEPETPDGPALPDGPEADGRSASEFDFGLRPIQVEKIARTIAVKAFVADLLRELKAVAA